MKNVLKPEMEKGSAIVITVGNEADVSKLCAKKGLRFGEAPKVVEKYLEAGPSSVCMTCSGMGHDQLGGCNERPEQCVICTGAHKSKKNIDVELLDVQLKKGRFCIHVVPKMCKLWGIIIKQPHFDAQQGKKSSR